MADDIKTINIQDKNYPKLLKEIWELEILCRLL